MTSDTRAEPAEDGRTDRTPANSGDESDPDRSVSDRLETPLERARTDPRAHAVAVTGAVIVGLAFSWLHWVGLVFGGALVGFLSPTLPRALLGGVGFGVIVLVAFALVLGEAALVVAGTTPIVSVALAAAIGLPAFGSLARLLH
ncbi:hypothetical protein [Natronobacterium gregoryi]|uniref:Uncharacterized protein n=2 Tax=Natronobacterium gregoryi TaxID=44930 RepID=L0AL85_NATGS|nr:hypothetical protein [Natronobacterium gregoryi]AFZ73957.1 hypothetical protein Natgr_2813 [Natronobacterium gregoryi SP2]ELY71707.1 hypothetical protein C490_04702 [Natronobacterium gregoryi SP2]PLK19537.1 hypothetical protein CYV19_14420 [Natronobacterium gregoryi SP2]SFJ47232.1 hypothetical protein SAMN05443661_13231 [Natronobacterium gregoryi]